MPNLEARFQSQQECRGGIASATKSLQECGVRLVLVAETLSSQDPFREFRFCSIQEGRMWIESHFESAQLCGGFAL